MSFLRWILVFATLTACSDVAYSQSFDQGPYSFRSSFAGAASYSNNSNRLLLGKSYNRHLIELEAVYSRRLMHWRSLDWNYDFELRPLTFIQDPVSTTTQTIQFAGQPPYGPFPIQSGPIQSSCHSATITNPNGPVLGQTVIETKTCGTRWTYAGGVSPLGQRINFADHRRIQPFLFFNGGFLISPRDLPDYNSSSFNFTFDFGGGVQLFRDHHHAMALDYRIHHLSNAGLGTENPGMDSQVIRLSYSLSR
jgi:hypothetical protein